MLLNDAEISVNCEGCITSTTTIAFMNFHSRASAASGGLPKNPSKSMARFGEERLESLGGHPQCFTGHPRHLSFDDCCSWPRLLRPTLQLAAALLRENPPLEDPRIPGAFAWWQQLRIERANHDANPSTQQFVHSTIKKPQGFAGISDVGARLERFASF